MDDRCIVLLSVLGPTELSVPKISFWFLAIMYPASRSMFPLIHLTVWILTHGVVDPEIMSRLVDTGPVVPYYCAVRLFHWDSR